MVFPPCDDQLEVGAGGEAVLWLPWPLGAEVLASALGAVGRSYRLIHLEDAPRLLGGLALVLGGHFCGPSVLVAGELFVVWCTPAAGECAAADLSHVHVTCSTCLQFEQHVPDCLSAFACAKLG